MDELQELKIKSGGSSIPKTKLEEAKNIDAQINIPSYDQVYNKFQTGIDGKNLKLDATIKFDFEGKGTIYIDGKSDPNSVSNKAEDSDCTVILSLETLSLMQSGQLDGMAAMMGGKLKVEGDMQVAMKLKEVFEALKGDEGTPM